MGSFAIFEFCSEELGEDIALKNKNLCRTIYYDYITVLLTHSYDNVGRSPPTNRSNFYVNVWDNAFTITIDRSCQGSISMRC